MHELLKYIMNFDLNSLSVFFRENNKNLHLNIKEVLSNYNLFDISNKDLENLREEFFMEQIKKKLDDPLSNWETDQLDALNIYRREWELSDKIIKKEITHLQNKVQLINNDYEHVKSMYIIQLKKCNSLKNKIEELIESKSGFENVIIILSTEIQTLEMFNKGNNKIHPPINNSYKF